MESNGKLLEFNKFGRRFIVFLFEKKIQLKSLSNCS